MSDDDIESLKAQINRLSQTLLVLTQEHWVTRDRLTVLEHVLRDNGIDAPALVRDYQPDSALSERLTMERQSYVKKIVESLGVVLP